MVFDHVSFAGHEQVLFCHDPATDLRAIIAIHSRRLGPAAGGCRMWAYGSVEEALQDVLRLSEAMTYKNALAGLPLGGGKSVIIGDPRTAKTPDRLAAFAGFVERLHGIYWTAEDVGIGAEDVAVLNRTTRYVFGLPNGTGDPSPFTARGVFEGIRACLNHRRGTPSLKGVTVAVQGVGNVGYSLCQQLHEAGARLIVADVRPEATARAQAAFGAAVMPVVQVHTADADVFAPCALGAVLNEKTVKGLKAGIVCGAANNQLATPGIASTLAAQGVLYAPDFVVNAGGMLNAAWDIIGGYSEAAAFERIARIYETMGRVLKRADAEGTNTMDAANAMAREVIGAAG